MTERRAFMIVFLGGLLLEAVVFIGLVAVGVRGPVLSLGVIGPLALTSYLTSGLVMRYGSSSHRRRR
jgi:hypothetical protein